MLNLKNINLIGKNVVIENSSDLSKINVNGLVIFETKNILTIKNKENEIKKIKKNEILKLKDVMWCLWLNQKLVLEEN